MRPAPALRKKYDLINNLKPILPAGAEFILKQNYPNPAVGSTIIEFSIPQQAITSLNLYNILGQRIKSIINEDLVEGTYRIPVDISELENGVYLYKMRYGNKEQTLKMNIVR